MQQNNIESIKLIAIAGPSSSGKTTFTNRVRIELMSRGIKPLMISIDDYYTMQGQTKVTNLISLEEFVDQGSEMRMDPTGNSHFEQPERALEQEEMTGMISAALEELTDKERQVVMLYYYEEMTLKEISMVLEVSESRVSQLHTKSLVKLKKKLGPYMNIFTE